MSNRVTTILGAVGAILAFLGAAPELAGLCSACAIGVAALNAGIQVVLGKTNTGTVQVSDSAMTILGAVNAMLSIVMANVSAVAPLWARLALGALNAAVSFFIGKTHPGTN